MTARSKRTCAAQHDAAAVATELVRRRELSEALAALDAARIPVLVFKGAALAYTHYPHPSDRPRLDADLLVAPGDQERAASVLEQHGYRHPLRIPGDLSRSQALYEKTDALGVHHAIDLHWRISKPQIFSHMFSMDELAQDAVPVAGLGPSARTPGPLHALAIACMHRVAHHLGDDRDRESWLYDIHLIAGRLDASQARAFGALAARKQIAAICAAGLSLAARRFDTAQQNGLREAVESVVREQAVEPSAAYLRDQMRRVDVLVSDLGALPTWAKRARLIREHVFPPASYMRETYGVSSAALLPALYAWRVIHGVVSWFRSPKSF